MPAHPPSQRQQTGGKSGLKDPADLLTFTRLKALHFPETSVARTPSGG